MRLLCLLLLLFVSLYFNCKRRYEDCIMTMTSILLGVQSLWEPLMQLLMSDEKCGA